MAKFLSTLLICTLLVGATQAQVKTVTGIVKDTQDGMTLPGVSVMIKGTHKGTQTGIDGKFSVSASKNQTLVFTYIGYASQEVLIGSNTLLQIGLKRSENALKEVLVVAYGTASKQQITGSVTTVKADDIQKRPVSSVTGVLEGSAAGIQVNNSTGTPGADPSIRIRGFSSINGSQSPLYVVDGVVFGGNISDLNPADIESISVLKDATSAALYGSRGSSGVIIITTKKGKGEHATMNLSVNQGVYTRGIEEYSRMNPNQFMETMWTGYRNQLRTTSSNIYPTEQLANAEASRSLVTNILGLNIYNLPNDKLFDSNGKLNANAQILDGYKNDLDWYKSVERLGHRQDYNISGGAKADKSSYFFSAGYLDEKGYIKKSDFKRFTGRLNADISPRKWITAGMVLSGTHQLTNNISTSTTGFNNPFFFARSFSPIYPIHLHDKDGNYILDSEGNTQYDDGTTYNRPQYVGRHVIWENELNTNRTYRNTLNGQLHVDISFLKDFKFSVRGDLNARNTENQTYDNAVIGDGAGNNGRSGRVIFRYKNYTAQQLLTYNKTIKEDHHIDFLAGHENYYNTVNQLSGDKSNQTFAGAIPLANFTNITRLSDYEDNNAIESYLTRARYNYKEKYFGEASFRMDGSSRFAPKNNWGSFWSVGGSWIISKENFMTDIQAVNNLKLRASYGAVGNDASAGLYAYQGLYSMAQNGNTAALYKSQNPANDLVWESQGAFSTALEGRLFGRMNFLVEYFDKTSNKLIFNVNQPLTAGATSSSAAESIIQQNIGKSSNYGIELTADVDIIKKPDWNWNVGVNATFMKNKIKALPPQNKDGIINGTKKLQEGHNIYDFWLNQFVGVDQMTGNALYLPDNEKYNVNGSSSGDPIPAEFLVKIGENYYTTNVTYGKRDWSGSAMPDVFGSFNSSLRWKNLSFSALFTYSLGGKMLDYSYRDLMSAGSAPNALSTDLLKAWNGIPTGMTANSPDRINPNGVPVVNFERNQYNNAINSTRFLHNASYFVVKNIALSYKLPKAITQKLDLGGASVNCGIENLATFTTLKGMNPQQSFSGINDNLAVTPRVFSLGFNIQL